MAELDKNTLPEGVEINTQGVISCTRAALNKLGDWCRKNAGALAVSVFATTGVHNALAQTTPIIPSTSVSATADKGGGQTVDTPFGTLSFAQIQKHPKKDEILDDIMTTEQSTAYNNWIRGKTQTANQEGKAIDARIQASNQNNQAKLQVEQASNQTYIKKAYAYVGNVEKSERLQNNPQVQEYLKKLYEDPLLPQDLIARIEVLIAIGG